jgi:beta-galactosidase
LVFFSTDDNYNILMLQVKYISFFLITFLINRLDLLNSNHGLTREKININQDWLYLENNDPALYYIEGMGNWQKINLPHTWNQWDAMDNLPGYRRDGSWYKKNLNIGSKKKANYILYFEGSNISTKLYVNKKFVGEHIGGYVGFKFDITSFIKENKSNEILIRVDNSYNTDIIPSQKADFFIYGGITRDVWLEKIPLSNLQDLKITTPNVNSNSASIKAAVAYTIENNKEASSIEINVFAPKTNKLVSTIKKDLNNASKTIDLELPNVTNPQLWSPDEPNLYSVEVNLIRSNKIIDQLKDKIGFRWFEFKPNGPFYLNGKRLLLRGTHRHEDHAGVGPAMSNDQHYKDMASIKEMGANFVRLAHYPQDPEVYKACDELGLIVWDELPWCRGGMGEEKWQANTQRLLEEQIKQNFNHPSIFFWSLGNEFYWLPDFPGGDHKDKLNTFLKKLNTQAHNLDPYRLTAIRKHYDGSDIADVFSPSIWSGWYAGIYKNYEATLIENQKKYKSMLHMEYGGTSHVSRHVENPIDGIGLVNETKWEEVTTQVNLVNIAQKGDNSENYMVDLFDWYLKVTENKDDFGGNAQWAFKDFGTPLRPEDPIPFMNQKGITDRAGNPKDVYYVFQSYWAKKPMVYIESHTWTERNGNPEKTISVFSNCPSVQFSHNGKILDTKVKDKNKFPASGLTWDVVLTPGENKLEAIAMDSDGKVLATDHMTLNFTPGPALVADHLEMTQSTLPNGNVLITALAVDKNNKRALGYEKKIYFSLDGNGKLLENYGYPGRSSVIEMSNGKSTIEVEPGKTESIVEVRNHDFKGCYIKIKGKAELSGK